jgi:hypothetical protein
MRSMTPEELEYAEDLQMRVDQIDRRGPEALQSLGAVTLRPRLEQISQGEV